MIFLARYVSRIGATAALLFGVVGCNSSNVISYPAPPGGASSGKIAHIVVMVQENRSFDNIFAGFPGANTVMEGACVPRPWCKGSHMIPLHSVTLEHGVGLNQGTDIDHSHNAFEIECDANASNVCQMDGFDLIRYGESGGGTLAKTFPYAYIDRTESKPY